MVFFITLLVFIIAYNVNKDKDVSDCEPMTPEERAESWFVSNVILSNLSDE